MGKEGLLVWRVGWVSAGCKLATRNSECGWRGKSALRFMEDSPRAPEVLCRVGRVGRMTMAYLGRGAASIHFIAPGFLFASFQMET